MLTSLASQNSIAYAQPQLNQLSSSQSDALKSVLSNYDANNITETDAKNIVKNVRDLGIAPGRPLTIVFAGQGFDAGSIGDKAGVGKGEKPNGPPPGGGAGGPKGQINTEALSALTLLLEAKDGEDVTETEWSDFYAELEEQGVDTSQPFIDLKL